MYVKYRFFAFFLIFTLAFFNGYLYAQESNDLAEAPEAMGNVNFEPSDDELASLLTGVPNPNAVVGPLIQTKWGQGTPYNNLFPLVNGQRRLTDCGTTARAQIMAFHRHPARGRGQSTVIGPHGITVPTVNLNVQYNWNNMLNSYRRDGRDSNEQQRNAVATLMYHIGAARGANGNLSVVFTDFFGYDRSIQRHWRLYYNDAEWEALIRQQLDAGLPVYYHGSNPSSHAFIIDGYDSTGRFHINWGWGGRHDGWYFLNNFNLNGERLFANNHTIVINIKPDEGGVGSSELFLRNFSVGKTAVSHNEMFTVTVNMISPGFFIGGQAGVALVDDNGRIITVIGTANYSARNPSTTGTREINCFIPETVRPGQYRLMTVIRPTNGEWRVVTRSAIGDGVPNFINLTVNAETGSLGGGYGLAIMSITPDKTTVSQNERFNVVSRTRNISQEAFPGGQMGAAIVDNTGNIVAVIGTASFNALNSGSTWTRTISNCSVPNTVEPGRYRLMVVVRPNGGEWRIATMSIDNAPNSIEFTVR